VHAGNSDHRSSLLLSRTMLEKAKAVALAIQQRPDYKPQPDDKADVQIMVQVGGLSNDRIKSL
jgi:hypothetical protein